MKNVSKVMKKINVFALFHRTVVLGVPDQEVVGYFTSHDEAKRALDEFSMEPGEDCAIQEILLDVPVIFESSKEFFMQRKHDVRSCALAKIASLRLTLEEMEALGLESTSFAE